MEPDILRVRVTVRGWVQGVGFRAFVLRQAAFEGVSATATNQSDGTVRCLLEGTAGAVDRLVGALREGPSLARVDSVDFVAEVAAGDQCPTDSRVR